MTWLIVAGWLYWRFVIVDTKEDSMKAVFYDNTYRRAMLTRGWIRKETTVVVWSGSEWLHEDTLAPFQQPRPDWMKEQENTDKRRTRVRQSKESWSRDPACLPRARTL